MRQDPSAPADFLTITQFAALPPGEDRLELVRGRVVREPPAGYGHGRVAARVIHLLNAFVSRNDLGDVLSSETGFVLFRDPPTVRAPDAAFVARERIAELETEAGYAALAPDLAVEVASPGNTLGQIHDKVLDYLEAGTRLVWIVEPRRRTVTVYRAPDAITLLREADTLEGGEVLPGFRVAVADLFGRGMPDLS